MTCVHPRPRLPAVVLRHGAGFAALAVGIAAVALYLPTVRAGLVWDDNEYALAGRGQHLVQALSGDLLAADPAQGDSGYWRPVAVLSYLAVRAVTGGAWAHHLASALLHGLTAALLVLLLARRTGQLAAAVLPALLWAVHPAQAETVAWASARYDLLTGLWAVALLLLPVRPGLRHPAAVFALFLAGLLSKESFVAIALVVVADDLGAGRGPRAAWPRWAAVAAALAAWLALRAALGIPGVATPGLAAAPAQALAALAHEAVRAVAPLPLTVSHPVGAPSALALLAGAGAAAGLLALAWRGPGLAAPAALFAGPLLVASLAIVSMHEAPDRYFYLPSLGLAWLLAAGLGALSRVAPAAARAAAALTAAAALASAVAVALRLPDWRSDAALFGAALRVDPEDALGHTALGVEAARAGRLDEARTHLEQAMSRNPEAARAASALAWVHLHRGDAPAALAAARRAVALRPSSPQAHLYLANALHLASDHGAELVEAGRAAALSPHLREARITRALARCEVEGPACEPELDLLAGDGTLSGADLLAARAEAGIRLRDPAAALERVARLRAQYPADPRLRVLEAAARRLGGERPE